MRSRFVSPMSAFFGRRKKNTEAPPRNGSIYRLNVLGKRLEWFAVNHRLPPGHFKNGVITSDPSASFGWDAVLTLRAIGFFILADLLGDIPNPPRRAA